jgi:hypothetical protein
MTLQQKRRAMAEACPGIFGFTVMAEPYWRDTHKEVTEREWLYAVQQAAKTILDKPQNGIQAMQYCTWIQQITRREKAFMFALDEEFLIEGFLKVKGLWRE